MCLFRDILLSIETTGVLADDEAEDEEEDDDDDDEFDYGFFFVFNYLRIFVDSMARRGHPRREISSLIHKQLTKLKFGSTHRHQHHNPKKSVFALLRYSRSVPIRSLQRCFRKHAPILKHVFKYDMTAGIAFKIQPNMFRTHFRDNHWH